jgi:SAM-dependent MidA family methyltransferase
LDKDPYTDVGCKDITADVDFTGLLEAGLDCDLEAIYFNSQASFLLAAGRAIWEASSELPVDQRLAIQHLLHPSGMGESFQVFLQSKNAPLPQFLMEASNRLKRLQWVAPSGKMNEKSAL